MRHHHRRWGHGPSMFGRGNFPSRPELIERLESFQRDLEQQLADVADVLTHLRDSTDDASAPQQQI